MAARGFNFEKANKQTEEGPKTNWPGFGNNEAYGGNGAWVWAVLFLILGFLIAVIVHRFKKKSEETQTAEKKRDRFHDICIESKLTEEEERILIDSITEAGIAVTEDALMSQKRFNAVIAPAIEARVGEKHCERIRRKLYFGGEMAEEPKDFGGTRDLASGSKLRLHFHGIPGTHTCTVIGISDKSFVVTLPMAGERHIHPRKGEIAEGFMELGNSLFSFESMVEETFLGGVFACKIKHTSDIKKAHQRESSRVNLAEKIIFSHFSGSAIESGNIDMANLESQLTDRWEGVLRDLSVGGCAIATPARKDFEVGDFVKFKIKLLKDEPEHSIFGQVVHVSPIPAHDGGGRILHIQFLGLDEEAQGSITRAVMSTRES
ncbi:MAG: PilZ domain-containing protein [Planctomycetes bacterium]|nr:PilZ domain-containing protein [Planctomycetota bacterium]